MDRESLIAKLREIGYRIDKVIRVADDGGWRLTLMNGAVIHSFDDGRCVVNGRDASVLRLVLRSRMLGSGALEAGSGTTHQQA